MNDNNDVYPTPGQPAPTAQPEQPVQPVQPVLPPASQGGSRKKSRAWKTVLIIVVTALVTFTLTAGGGLMVFFGLASSGAITWSDQLSLNFPDTTDNKQALSKLNSILQEIEGNYYLDVTDAQLLEAMAQGAVNELGNRYTMYLSAENYKQLTDSLSGNYSGIGAFVGLNKDGLVEITEVVAGSPAEAAGIQIGDLIIEVDGKDVTGLNDTSAVAALVRGKEGTTVNLGIYRPSTKATIKIDVVRKKISTTNVTFKMLASTVGYVRVREFSNNTASAFQAAMGNLQAQGARSIVFDLRNNPGGLATEVTAMLDYLLPEAVIATLKGRNNGQPFDESWTSDKNMGVPADMQYAIITNSFTASASELFSGCLHDLGKARLFGEQTFGKGSGTITVPLDDGSAIILTNFLYYLPNGESIEGTGIAPDVEIALPDAAAGKSIDTLTLEQDTQLKAALDYLASLK
jgi:carboxyl-terminal processing protease